MNEGVGQGAERPLTGIMGLRMKFTPYSPKPFPHYTCSATDSACYIGGKGLEIGSGGGSGGSGVRGG
eukprot:jgi/Tetstr1/457067/TSEL_043728.t1